MAANALVMVVDDDAKIRGLIRTILSREGCDVLEAADGKEALKRLDEALPDALIVDMVMPHVGGMEFIEEARKRDPMLSLIMMTGHGTVDAAVEAMRKGACDFISKPFEVQRLTSAVQKVLESQALRRAVFQLRSEQC